MKKIVILFVAIALLLCSYSVSATDSNYIYCAGGTTCQVWKIQKSDMSKVDECADVYGGNIIALTEDADYVYCAGVTPYKVWKIQKSDMVKSLESTNYGGMIRALTSDTDYVYCGGVTSCKVWKIQKSDMSKVDESISYGGTICALTEDADYIYCSGGTTRKVWKIQKSDMTKVDECADVYGGTIYALTSDTDYVYCGGTTTRKVWKIQKSDMVKVDESTSYAGSIYALTIDADYVYCGGVTTQKVWKIRKSDMVGSLISIDYGDTIWALTSDTDYVYCGGTTTQKVWKIQKSDMSKVDESTSYGGTILALTTWTPPPNNPPTLSNELPTNTSYNQSITPTVNVTVTDADGDSLTCDFYTSTDGISWTHRQTNTGVLDESISYEYIQATEYQMIYYWKVTANDGIDNVTSNIYNFETTPYRNTYFNDTFPNANWVQSINNMTHDGDGNYTVDVSYFTYPLPVVCDDWEYALEPSDSFVTVNKPSGTVENDLLISFVATDGVEIFDTPSGWNSIAKVSSDANSLASFYKIANDSEDISYTFTWGSSEGAVGSIIRITGVDTTNPIHVNITDFESSTGTDVVSPDITTTIDNCVILRVHGLDDNDEGDNYNGYPTNHVGIFAKDGGTCSHSIAYENLSNCGSAGTGAWTFVNAEEWVAFSIAVAPPRFPFYDGNIISDTITKTQDNWDKFYADVNNTANSTFKLLDTTTDYVIQDGLIGDGDNISLITNSSIRIIGCFNGSVQLRSWNITWTTAVVEDEIDEIIYYALIFGIFFFIYRKKKRKKQED